MAKDTRIPVRLAGALKAEFEWAAEQDGCVKGVSTWLRQLGEERAEELRTREQTAGMTLADATALQRASNEARSQIISNGSAAAEPAPLEFIPGLGLEEE